MPEGKSGFTKWLIYVDPRDPSRDVAEDLVRNGLSVSRVVPGRNGPLAAFADQNDFIPHIRGNAGDVNQGKVHRDIAYDAGKIIANNDPAAIGKVPVEPIGITHWQHRNASRSLGDISRAVPQRLSSAHVTNRDNACLPG